ncbi:MAG: helix-turn-helix domain-containing protein [Actinomycetota bacterium]|nr:helix-turn-helix domain-containing protein [Actinomycetota bacterium]
MTQENGPGSSVVRRWQLGETLRQLREQAHLTHDQVAAALRDGPGKWSRPKLSRIENRQQGVRPGEVERLLDLYRVTDPELRRTLVELARLSRDRGWVVDIRASLPQPLHRLLDWEAALVASRQFETLLVPGLLQTPEYARALITGIHPTLSQDEVERLVAARIARQQILSRDVPPQLHVILDAGVLERPVKSAQVMRTQLRRLAEATEAPHITIQVLPKSVGASPALQGPFTVLTPPEPMPDLGYVEGTGGARYIEDRDPVRDLTLRFGVLSEQALRPDESVRHILDAAEGYR